MCGRDLDTATSSPPRSLLRRLWLQMTSKSQDGSSCIRDILASLSHSGRKWRRASSIYIYSLCYDKSQCHFNAAPHLKFSLNAFVFQLRQIFITISLTRKQEQFHTEELLQMSRPYTQLNGGVNIFCGKKKKRHSTHSCL